MTNAFDVGFDDPGQTVMMTVIVGTTINVVPATIQLSFGDHTIVIDDPSEPGECIALTRRKGTDYYSEKVKRKDGVYTYRIDAPE